MISLSDSEAAKWIKAVEPVFGIYKKNIVDKGYKESEVDGWVKYIKERIEYWHKEQKKRGIPSAF
jgi:hypothetical protein